MPRSFSYGMSLTESPTQAQARLREVVTERVLQSTAMRPAQKQSDSMAFRPQWGSPLLVGATRRIRGEKINLAFIETVVGTSVEINGKVAGDAEIVADREFWAEMLTAP